jgi:hypothetical protein
MRLLKILFGASVAGLVLVYPLAYGLERTFGRDVIRITPGDPATVALNRETFDPSFEVDSSAPPEKQKQQLRRAIAEIYGQNASETERLVFLDESRIIEPEEDPSLTLYQVRGEEHPTQAKLLYFIAKFAAIGFAVGAAALFGLMRWLRRKDARAA